MVYTQDGWRWVVIGNTVMWGDTGDRQDQAEVLEGGPFTKKARELRAWGKVPFDIMNEIPTARARKRMDLSMRRGKKIKRRKGNENEKEP